MKVLYIVSSLKKTGPTNQLYNIIKYLDFSQFKPHIVTLSPEPEESMRNAFNELNVKIISCSLSRIKGMFYLPYLLKKIVKEINPHVIHTQGIRSDMLSAHFLKEYKRIATLRNYPYEDYKMTYGKILGTFMAYHHINSLKKIDIPVVCSESIKMKVKPHRLKALVVRNGVDQNIFYPVTKEEKQFLRKKLEIPDDKNVFISVGHLNSRKDPETVIRGFLSSVAKDNSLLLMIGDGPLRKSLQKKYENQSNVKFLGRKGNVDEYLKLSDYFISASLSEGLPNSVIEALACQVPVILSNIEQHKEILNFNVLAGKLFKVKNYLDLTSKINEFTDYKQAQKACMSIINKHLSASNMSKNYQSLYSREQ